MADDGAFNSSLLHVPQKLHLFAVILASSPRSTNVDPSVRQSENPEDSQ